MVPIRDEPRATSTAGDASGEADSRAARGHRTAEAAEDVEISDADENLHQVAGRWVGGREAAVLEAAEEVDNLQQVGNRVIRHRRVKRVAINNLLIKISY